jgi:DNA-binding PucR family transcriptional regulator
MHCGVSHAFHSVLDLRAFHEQAVRAVELGMLFEQDATLHWYDQCAVYQLLEHAGSPEAYMSDGLRRLCDWDKTYGGELVKTLEAYLQCRGNTAQCAKRLFLHVSTVKYRLNKIEEILQYSLNDGEHFFYLYLSMKILQYEAAVHGESDSGKLPAL